ncbi:hypothetical protein E2P81_ATG11520 [Venturia nashicola]|uniref:Uncharacterized protein n=1 Tax=Venturia nashicola TaxID=86259 RepID=A0A4Z1P3H2_9PEZI|nr:hypothetical protein E6O75_ATG11209 [Venturia nashicola]TLD35401.1 hypothetical protein E2P81_ATG11520 [Venturia nashicola]
MPGAGLLNWQLSFLSINAAKLVKAILGSCGGAAWKERVAAWKETCKDSCLEGDLLRPSGIPYQLEVALWSKLPRKNVTLFKVTLSKATLFKVTIPPGTDRKVLPAARRTSGLPYLGF